MHEFSLMQGLISEIEVIAEEHHALKILRIVVRIGPFAGVVIDSFQFAFDVLRDHYVILRQAELQIDIPPAVFTCVLCGRQSQEQTENKAARPDNPFPVSLLGKDMKCPHCGTGTLYPSGGDEIVLMQIEME